MGEGATIAVVAAVTTGASWRRAPRCSANAFHGVSKELYAAFRSPRRCSGCAATLRVMNPDVVVISTLLFLLYSKVKAGRSNLGLPVFLYYAMKGT